MFTIEVQVNKSHFNYSRDVANKVIAISNSVAKTRKRVKRNCGFVISNLKNRKRDRKTDHYINAISNCCSCEF